MGIGIYYLKSIAHRSLQAMQPILSHRFQKKTAKSPRQFCNKHNDSFSALGKFGVDARLRAGLHRQLEKLDASAEKCGGWKVGLTSGRMRDSMGEGVRPFGHILRSRMFKSGVSLALSQVGDIGVENELVFEFGKSVPFRATREELAECVAGVAAGFELNERRLPASATQADRLADNLSQWGIVVGELVKDWRNADIDDLSVSLICDGVEVERVSSVGHIDPHLDSLCSLSLILADFDRHIQAGDRVITGAFTRQRVSKPSNWVGDFGSQIGTVQVSWT